MGTAVWYTLACQTFFPVWMASIYVFFEARDSLGTGHCFHLALSSRQARQEMVLQRWRWHIWVEKQSRAKEEAGRVGEIEAERWFYSFQKDVSNLMVER